MGPSSFLAWVAIILPHDNDPGSEQLLSSPLPLSLGRNFWQTEELFNSESLKTYDRRDFSPVPEPLLARPLFLFMVILGGPVSAIRTHCLPGFQFSIHSHVLEPGVSGLARFKKGATFPRLSSGCV